MNSETYPAPDRSNTPRCFEKRSDDDHLDLGWAEGTMEDGRPYRAECWAADGGTWVTWFFVRDGIQDTNEGDLFGYLSRSCPFEVVGELVAHIAQITDDAGQGLWALTLLIGDGDGLHVRDSTTFRSYQVPQGDL